jgi:hypothetical protein
MILVDEDETWKEQAMRNLKGAQGQSPPPGKKLFSLENFMNDSYMCRPSFDFASEGKFPPELRFFTPKEKV